MKLTFRSAYGITGEITIEDSNTKIVTDIAKNEVEVVDNLLDVAIELNQFQGGDDVEFIIRALEQTRFSASDYEELFKKLSDKLEYEGYTKN